MVPSFCVRIGIDLRRYYVINPREQGSRGISPIIISQTFDMCKLVEGCIRTDHFGTPYFMMQRLPDLK